jgi:hypothetical protein
MHLSLIFVKSYGAKFLFDFFHDYLILFSSSPYIVDYNNEEGVWCLELMLKYLMTT